MTIGNRILTLRKKNGLKRTELARIIDVPVPTLRDWEKNLSLGKSLLDKLIPLSQELNVSISEILTGKSDDDLSTDLAFISPDTPTPEYCKIRLLHFLRFNSLDCNLYVKLSNKKYVKIINKYDLYTTDDILKFEKKGINDFYVKGNDYIPFVENLINIINLKVSDPKNATKQHASIFMTTSELINQLINSIGITEQTKKTIEHVIYSTVNAIEQNPKVANILSKINIGKEPYIYEHSLLQSYISSSLISIMNYSSESIMHKLCLASFLHDITFKNTKHAKLNNLDGLSWQDMKIVSNHPAKAAQLATTFNNFFVDVDKIIIDHHETFKGDGFPKGIGANQIPPLSGLFIICHDIVDLIYDSEKEKFSSNEFSKIVNSIKSKYSAFTDIKHVREIMAGLDKLVGLKS